MIGQEQISVELAAENQCPFVLGTDGSQEGEGLSPIVVTVERNSLCDKKNGNVIHVLLSLTHLMT